MPPVRKVYGSSPYIDVEKNWWEAHFAKNSLTLKALSYEWQDNFKAYSNLLCGTQLSEWAVHIIRNIRIALEALLDLNLWDLPITGVWRH